MLLEDLSKKFRGVSAEGESFVLWSRDIVTVAADEGMYGGGDDVTPERIKRPRSPWEGVRTVSNRIELRATGASSAKNFHEAG